MSYTDEQRAKRGRRRSLVMLAEVRGLAAKSALVQVDDVLGMRPIAPIRLSYLARRMGCDVKSARSALARLEADGLVAVGRAPGRPAVVTIVVPALAEIQPTPTGSGTGHEVDEVATPTGSGGGTPTGSGTATPTESGRAPLPDPVGQNGELTGLETGLKTATSRPAFADEPTERRPVVAGSDRYLAGVEFGELWTALQVAGMRPLRQQRARDEYVRARREASADEIASAADAYYRSWRGQRWPRGLASFLRERGWTEDPSEWTEPDARTAGPESALDRAIAEADQ